MSAKGKGKDKGTKKSSENGPGITEIILRKLLKYYEQYSLEFNVKCCPDVIRAIRQCLEEGSELKKIIVRPIEKDLKAEERFKKALLEAQEENDTKAIAELKANYNNTPPPILLEPLMKALNDVQVSSCKELYIIDLPLNYLDCVQLTYFLKLATNQINKLEILDCDLEPECMRRLASSFNTRKVLTSIALDYNEFGDKGCYELCKGLVGNRFLLSLSLNYCNLTYKSGEYLGEILATTALKELYLDGNLLRCQGALGLIIRIVEHCENEIILKELEEKARLEAEEKDSLRAAKPSWEREEPPAEPPPEEKKKRRKRRGKKKKTDEPPPVGAFVAKLHLADNGIDIYENGSNREESLNTLRQTIEMFSRLIKLSKELEELDLDNNTIGNMGASMLLNALEYRKLNDMGSVKTRVSEKIDKDLFDSILKASKKIKKKKKKGKKKS